MKHKKFALLPALIAATMGLGAQSASAGDSKIYPAASCQPERGVRAMAFA